ncbi:hypothetical protein [Enterobacter roggenkampii]|uniref:hypothetical protein n=1 Tax=Enterobacter roggenkampii TaxID=1812935 RepID=UPI0015DD4DF8|nr:hypothetical protein [Enterobacter roggenkampii]BBS39112.1 hypothetical protein WP5S18E01_39590 [Enterobacter cloacae]HEO9144418.1 hypothetical protein [Enterobacter asburiae]MCK6975253.1 hypothetical protein [Enterobacter roggenkampii]MCL8153838.1 hypothetical protein [Enterobacter roggenkampii]MCM7557622.1 hypothetical protein [Enterobacter roggenkampii]
MNYTSNMLKGFGTSSHIQNMHYRAALKVNDAIETHKALLADRTRTKSEKAPMLAKLQKKLEAEAQRDIQNILNNLNARADELDKKEAEILSSMSMTDALSLTAAMKGMDAGEMIAATRESKELALAMAIVPSALSGFSKDQAFKTLIDAHYPDIKAATDEMASDFRAYESLRNNVENTTREIGYDVDLKALESRFDENKLEVSPAPKTMAEQNAELARLERSSGIEPSISE